MHKRIIVHPFIIAVYPIFVLLAFNRNQVFFWTAYRSLIISIMMVVLIWLVFRLILRDWHKAAFISSLILLVFFTYGHIFTYLEDVTVMGYNFGRHRVLIGLSLIGIGLVIILLLRVKQPLTKVTQALNIISLVALAFPVTQLGVFAGRAAIQASSKKGLVSEAIIKNELSGLSVPEGQTPPDIYYLVFDTYTRDDTLNTYFQVDNAPFLTQLEEMGFYVARCGQSNYALTQPSLASSLNLDYLDKLGLEVIDINNPGQMNLLLRGNAVRYALHRLGYQIVGVESGFSPTEWEDADVYLSTRRGVGNAILTGGINPFEAILLKTSVGIFLYEYKPQLSYEMQSFLDTAYTEHRSRILYALDELAEVSEIPGPKFVFAHLLIPHSPFVFGANGEIVGRKQPFTLNDDAEIRDPDKYRKGFRDQLAYTNRRILPILRSILAKSTVPPIIILQGDHGTKAQVSSRNARLTILNAYHLPGNSRMALYPEITPVNTFRIIFDQYFGGQLPLLNDVSYFSQYGDTDNSPLIMPNERTDCNLP